MLSFVVLFLCSIAKAPETVPEKVSVSGEFLEMPASLYSHVRLHGGDGLVSCHQGHPPHL